MVTHDPELARRAPRNIQVVDGQLADFTLYQDKSSDAIEPQVQVNQHDSQHNINQQPDQSAGV